MGDSDLEAIRAKRMAQLQSQYQGGNASGDQAKAAQERQEQMTDMKNSILSQVLDQPARARLNTIMLCKPEKAQQIENMICQMAQSGQIMSKLGENELIGLLEQISSRTEKTSTVKFDRRRAALDSDDDDF
uniref:Programmed cell death protein 5 n=1 Tax=Cacopsylla melanoneura TaxID=428564 RepID=A0A8D9FEC1_9HEMI